MVDDNVRPMVHENPERVVTDAEFAAQIRADLQEPLTAICEIMGRARQRGLNLTFNVGPDSFGRIKITDINIIRPL